jgi:LCP family protein required for cell wall assembly
MEPPQVPQYTRYTVTPRRTAAPAWVRVLKWTVLLIVVVSALTFGMGFGYLQNTVNKVAGSDPATRATVKAVQKQLAVQHGTHAPVNILVLGSDRRKHLVGDTGRSDTIMLLRIDPATKSISMLSIPRDLRVEIPGFGTDRINAAYSDGGPALSVATFKALTGLPVNHFIDVNFTGFTDMVDYLGGVYIDVDRQYYNNTAVTGYSSISINAGYQRLNGADALSFVRYRHDQLGDWGRMQRQQLFLRELKRQALRWQNVLKLPQLISTMTRNTISDVSSIKKLLGLVELGLGANTQHIYQTHLVGEPIVINGADELQASSAEVAAVVDQFMHPLRPPVQQPKGESQPKSAFTVSVTNGGATAGSAAVAAGLLSVQGYTTAVAGNVLQGDSKATLVYATQAYVGNARALAAMLVPSRVVTVARAPGVQAGVSVVLGPSYTGTLVLPHKAPAGPTLTLHSPQDAAQWRALAHTTKLKLRMPTAWLPGFAYDWSMSRAYKIAASHGNRAAVAVVGTTGSGGYWHIEETSWTDPPAIASPDGSTVVKGVRYLEFYDGAKLHMVAWTIHKTLYWVSNTLDNELANDTMMGLATSFTGVK